MFAKQSGVAEGSRFVKRAENTQYKVHRAV